MLDARDLPGMAQHLKYRDIVLIDTNSQEEEKRYEEN